MVGEIEAVGKEVKSFTAGEQVFGMSPKSFGAYAEYKCLSEEAVLAVKPPNLTYEEAAGVCDGAPTALTFIFYRGLP